MDTHPLSAPFPLLDAYKLDELVAITETIKVKAGTMLIEEGRSSVALYLILDGVVTVTKHLGEMEIVISELSDGEVF